MKFIVPCNVKELLRVQYGEEISWSTPTKQNYIRANADWANGVNYTKMETLYMIRYYLFNGSVDVKHTIFNIKDFLDEPIYKLPSNDDEFI